jgi:hypothetical protein
MSKSTSRFSVTDVGEWDFFKVKIYLDFCYLCRLRFIKRTSIGSRSNRPQVKSAPGQIVPSQIDPSQIGPKSNRPLVIHIKLNGNTDIWLCSFSLMLRACWRSKNINFYSLWFDISKLKNDTLFVHSGQIPRSECHSFKLIRGS